MEKTLVTVGRATFGVTADGQVYREVRGEWKRVDTGKTVDEARAKAKNLRAIRASTERRAATRYTGFSQ